MAINCWIHSQVLLTIFIMWGLCLVLTLTDTFPEGHAARTDVRIRVLEDSPWFYIPYPGQFGFPTVTVAGLFALPPKPQNTLTQIVL